jgi:tetratricopeptide (TPR) repeat protein
VKRAVLVAALALASCKKDDAPTHLEAARTAQFAQKLDVALAEYKLVLDRLERDTSPQANLYRARALRGAADLYAFHLNDPRRAVEVYRELITVCPEAPETLEGRLHLASVLRHDFRDLRGAIAEYTAALARNPPQSAELTFTVARLYFELQDYEQCELEAGRPRYHVAKFQMIAAPSSESTIARPRPVLMLTSRSTGSRWTMLKATPIPPHITPRKFQRPDQTTAAVGFNDFV